MKMLKSFALIALLAGGHYLNAMENIPENITAKVKLVKGSVDDAIKQIKIAKNPSEILLHTFKDVKGDIDRIVTQSKSLKPEQKVYLYNQLHDYITPLHHAYQVQSMKGNVPLATQKIIDKTWMEMIDKLNVLIRH